MEIENIELAYLSLDDYQELKQAMIESYASMPDSYWHESPIRTLINRFPEGQVVIKVNNQIAGCALSIVVDYARHEDNHSYKAITGDYTFSTHTDDGDVLYGIEVFIKPQYRGLRLGRRLYDYRKELCERLNLKGVAFGGRIPNFHKYSDQLTPKEYIQKVKMKEIHDPVLNFQISNDFHPTKVLKNYLDDDKASNGFAVLLEWDNIYYEKQKVSASVVKKIVRLGIVQWQMRRYTKEEELMQQAEYFVDSVSRYRSDFAIFPEFFNAPLLSAYNDMKEHHAIRKLAEHTESIVQKFSKLAITYNINIVTGSMPEIYEDRLYNVGYLCRRDGTVDHYEKIHVTPDESKIWGMEGGRKLSVLDTDCGKIGVLINFDVQIPELARLLAEEGMDILIVPFLTDTQNAYARIRHCAQARAIENECYVAIAGCVGNLPNVLNMDIQYAQSMVFTPCDFAFPTNGIKAEASTNSEMILIADVDIDLLRELNRQGSVRNLQDRRNKDMFELRKR